MQQGLGRVWNGEKGDCGIPYCGPRPKAGQASGSPGFPAYLYTTENPPVPLSPTLGIQDWLPGSSSGWERGRKAEERVPHTVRS
ncbi:hypothetical protein H8959_009439 [Pygathrix nigripes]